MQRMQNAAPCESQDLACMVAMMSAICLGCCIYQHLQVEVSQLQVMPRAGLHKAGAWREDDACSASLFPGASAGRIFMHTF